MKKAKLLVTTAVIAAMSVTTFAGCGNSDGQGTSNQGDSTTATEAASNASSDAASAGDGSVYMLNFKPEVDQQMKDLADVYTEQTGVPVTIVTAASGTYEQTLTSEMAKTECPTIFFFEPSFKNDWKDYMYDFTGTFFEKHLTAEPERLDSGEYVGIPYAVESYGIIYNVDLLDQYCALDNAVISSAADIVDFDTLKAVADDIQSRKDELGVEGAFTSAGLDGSSYWRFVTHLVNMPIYWEMEDKGVDELRELDGTYVYGYKNLMDLYFTDSTCDSKLLSGKTGDDAMAEFCEGQAVFYQNGTWAWTPDNDMAGMNVAFLPLYTGVPAEKDAIGVCSGSGNFMAVNKKASPENVDASLKFLEWMFSSDEGKEAVAGAMAFNCPMDTFSDIELENPLFASANSYVEAGKTAVSWKGFNQIPDENWKTELSSALIEYAQGTGDWDTVEKCFTEKFAEEWATKE